MLDKLRSGISWPRGEKSILIVLWALFAAMGVYLVVAYFSGGAFAINWVEESVSQPLRILYDRFAAGLYEFSIFADNYVVVKTFRSGDITINTTAAYLFLLVFVLALVFLLAIATTLSRFYFLLFCGFFVVILITFRLENVMLFGWYNKETYFLALFSFLLPAYYFHAFRPLTAMLVRFVVFLAIALALSVLIAIFSEVERPFFYIISYGLVSPLILSVIFVLLIGFEVVKGFLTIVTRHASENGKNNFLHFAVLSVIYMGVLAMIFLYNEKYIDWKIIFIDAVWILLVAGIVGFWGFRDREVTYSHIFRFQSTGAYIYLTLGTICFSSLAYFLASANDPLVEVIEDAVIFSQLAYSIIFFTYVVANFFPAMMEGLPVYKIVYKPKNMPFFTASLAALIGVVAFFLLSKMAAYYQAYSGYYISIANLHALENDDLVASEYYELSNIYGKETHYGNLALAKMAEKKGESALKENYLAKSINRNPTEFAFADLARHYERRTDYFDALFVLSRGLEYFPSSGPLANNMGVLLSKTNVLDSAAQYYLQAGERTQSAEAALTNIYALYTHDNLRIGKDSLEQFMNETEHYPAENNLIVTAAKNGYTDMPVRHQVFFGDGINRDRLVYNFNSILFQPEKIDSSQWQAFQVFYEKANSRFFFDEMQYAFALAYAKNGRSIAAMRIFNTLNRSDSYDYKKYDLVIAQYLMKFGAYRQALDHYQETYRFYGANILAEMAFATMESGNWRGSQEIWEAVRQSEEPTLIEIGNEMIDLCNLSTFREVVKKEDHEKYLFLKYRHREITYQEHEGLILSIEQPDFSSRAYIDLMERFLDHGMLHEAARIAAVIPMEVYHDNRLAESYLKQMARLALRREDGNALADLLPALKSRQRELMPYYMAVQALKYELDGFYDRAGEIYENLGVFDAFCDECILLSADFMNRNRGDKMKAYTILLDAIEINKYSLPLNKAYISKALEMGLDSYANDVLEKMHEVLSGDRYLELMHYTEEQREKYQREW